MWDDVEIVSVDQAKQHARITSSDEDDDLALKLRQAHGLVLDYIDRPTDEDWHAELLTWDDSTAPAAVQAAILRMFQHLYRFRGDDEPQKPEDGLGLPSHVTQLLRLYRTPALA